MDFGLFLMSTAIASAFAALMGNAGIGPWIAIPIIVAMVFGIHMVAGGP